MSDIPLKSLLTEIRNCDFCTHDLPLGANPIIRASSTAKILIIGQAPGTRVHDTGIPWNDPSGNKLRQWLQLSDADFYDENQIAIMPMGLCYPGKGKSGDLPPRKECAPKWHHQVFEHLPDLKLILLIGQYAQRSYLKDGHNTVTERVKHAAETEAPFFSAPASVTEKPDLVKEKPLV